MFILFYTSDQFKEWYLLLLVENLSGVSFIIAVVCMRYYLHNCKLYSPIWLPIYANNFFAQ